jgi:hypothetical protein
MALVPVSEAAKLCGKDRKTLYRQIKEGKLSATKDETGATKIDIAELVRVYGALRNISDTQDSGNTVALPQPETIDLRVELALLKAEVANLKERLGDKESHIEDMRNSMRLLGHSEPNQPKKSGFFSWFKGK